ncbi:Panacea domain-containing protein [Chloroflexota bacterium]
MERIQFNFDLQKATQALNWLAIKSGGRISKLKALKLLYLADRYHLRKYGRLITNDIYFAMDYGPVPSGSKDLAEASDFLGDDEQEYSSKYIKPINQYTFESLADPDPSVFSDSDIESLAFAWDTFGHLARFDLANITHEYPEWKKHKQALKLDSRIQMNLMDFFDDPRDDIEKCHALDSEEKNIRREQLAEIAHIESLWS